MTPETPSSPVEATICLLVRGTSQPEVLLGLKKVGFGVDKYGGVGGKVEPGETAAHAAVRELEEETGILAQEADLCRMAHLTFLFPYKPEWSQVVHVFVIQRWVGRAAASREIDPAWFPVDGVPYDRMWADCRHWLPRVLGGERVRARFTFGADNETIEGLQVSGWDGRI